VNQKGSKILVWLLSWAVLAVVIIYSPIGSPDLYTSNQYIVYSQGVNFEGGIANAPKARSYQTNEMPELGVPVYTPTTKSYATSAPASGASGLASQATSYSAGASTTGRTAVAAPSGGSSGGIAVGTSSRKSQGNVSSQNVGLSAVSLSTDLNVVDPTVNKPQAVDYSPNSGGTDPGDDDPIGPPIPVGDGLWLLLLMAGGYALWKRN